MADVEPPSSPGTMAAHIDPPHHLIGFHNCYHISPDLVSGRVEVTDLCCQPFKVLHGGVSALIAEATASLGEQLASEIAGVELNINHLRAAVVGDVVSSEARPIFSSKSVQVWEVNLW